MKLTKKHVVVYNDEKLIIMQTDDNWETIVPKGVSSAEFDTSDELNQFIKENQLTDEPTKKD